MSRSLDHCEVKFNSEQSDVRYNISDTRVIVETVATSDTLQLSK